MKKLRNIIPIMFSSITLVFLVLFCIVVMNIIGNELNNIKDDEAENVIALVINALDNTSLQDVKTNTSESIFTDSLEQKFNEYLQISGSEYLYILDVGDKGKVRYLIDGTSKDSEFFSKSGTVEANPDPALLKAISTKETVSNKSIVNDYGHLKSVFHPVLDENNNINYIVGVDFDLEEISKTKNGIYLQIVLMLLAILTLSSICIAVYSYFLSRNISTAVNHLDLIKQGNLSWSDIKTKSQTEIGTLYSSANIIKNNFSNFVVVLNELVTLLKKTKVVVDNELNESLDTSQDMLTIANDTKKLTLVQSENLENLDLASKSTLESSIVTKKFFEEVRDTLELNVNDNKVLSRKLKEMDTDINKLSESLNNTDKFVDGLENSISEIASVVDMIRDISDMTDLLSLNAQIESARAGEAGKGFSVVAQEVSKLSTQTKDSVNKVEKLINRIVNSIGEVTVSIKESKGISELQKEITTQVVSSYEGIESKNVAVLDQIISVNEKAQESITNCELVLDCSHTVLDITNSINSKMEVINNTAAIQSEQISKVKREVMSIDKVNRELTTLTERYIK